MFLLRQDTAGHSSKLSQLSVRETCRKATRFFHVPLFVCAPFIDPISNYQRPSRSTPCHGIPPITSSSVEPSSAPPEHNPFYLLGRMTCKRYDLMAVAISNLVKRPCLQVRSGHARPQKICLSRLEESLSCDLSAGARLIPSQTADWNFQFRPVPPRSGG